MRSGSVTRESSPHSLSELIQQGAYLTDGVALFRVAGVVSGSRGPTMVELEDCLTLEIRLCRERDVMNLGLHPVKAG